MKNIFFALCLLVSFGAKAQIQMNDAFKVVAQKSVDDKQYMTKFNKHVPYDSVSQFLYYVPKTRRHIGEICYIYDSVQNIDIWQFKGGIDSINLHKIESGISDIFQKEGTDSVFYVKGGINYFAFKNNGSFSTNHPYPVQTIVEMLALDTAKVGDIAIVADSSKSYVLSEIPSSVQANWLELLSPVLANTDYLPEGSTHLYSTTQRIRNAISADWGITYDNTAGKIKADSSALKDIFYNKDSIDAKISRIETGSGSVTSVAKGYGILQDGTITTTGTITVDSAALADKFKRITDSTDVSTLNGGKIDTSRLPISKLYIQQAGAGETHIVRAANDTTLSVATLKNTDDITISKASDSAVLLQFTHPHYTKDQVDSIAATLTASGITRAELIDTADNKVNKTDVSGGAINQVLKKNSSTDYDWSWQDESGGVAQSVISDTLKNYANSGSITTDNVVYSTPIALSVANHLMTGSLALKSQAAYTVLVNNTGSSAAPVFAKIPVQSINATGTPSSTSFLAGDATWKSIGTWIRSGDTAIYSTSKVWLKDTSGNILINLDPYRYMGDNFSSIANTSFYFNGKGSSGNNANTLVNFLSNGVSKMSLNHNGDLFIGGNFSAGLLSAATINPTNSAFTGTNSLGTIFKSTGTAAQYTGYTTTAFWANNSYTGASGKTFYGFLFSPSSFSAGGTVVAFQNTVGDNFFNTTSGGTSVGDSTTIPSSVKFQVTSTSKGVLIPKMTKTERNAITSPAPGLMVIVTGETGGEYLSWYNSSTSGWVKVSSTAD